MNTSTERRPLSGPNGWLRDFKNQSIAAATGVSRESVTAWRSGAAFPRGKQLIKICKFIRIDLAQIVLPDDQDEAA